MKPGAAFIAAISGYECAAILSGERCWPTITRLWRARPMLVRRLLLAAVAWWLWWHIEVDCGD